MPSLSSTQTIAPGRFPETLTRHLLRFHRDRWLSRLGERRTDLWSEDPAHHAVAAQRLGWLDPLPLWDTHRQSVAAWADSARAAVRDVVLLGMGGSSLAPEVIARVAAPGGAPHFHMLDSTDPDSVRGLTARLDPRRTLFIVASKSGGTIETLSHLAFFYAWVKASRAEPGPAFVAITDEGSALHRLGAARGFAHVFLNPADIGGRYSALSLFGMVPAALMGVDLAGVSERVRAMLDACGPEAPRDENPALTLGAMLGAAAAGGADKLTLLTSPALRPFGAWVEQLVAESTGKAGKGLVPIDGEPDDAAAYGTDRCAVALRLEGEPGAGIERTLSRVRDSGAPLIEIVLPDRMALFGEFYKWEVATAAAAAILRVDPFDEPNVQESKDQTKTILAYFHEHGALPEDPVAAAGDRLAVSGAAADVRPTHDVVAALRALFASVKPGMYLALLGYLDRSSAVDEAMTAIRRRLGAALQVPTLFGYGPRYLHSIGQLYKGGPPTGAFLVLTADHAEDVPIPDAPYTFGQLQMAQALGDVAALRKHDRPVRRVHLKGDLPGALEALDQAIASAL